MYLKCFPGPRMMLTTADDPLSHVAHATWMAKIVDSIDQLQTLESN